MSPLSPVVLTDIRLAKLCMSSSLQKVTMKHQSFENGRGGGLRGFAFSDEDTRNGQVEGDRYNFFGCHAKLQFDLLLTRY